MSIEGWDTRRLQMKTETGAASILITLKDGDITIHHGTDKVLLAEMWNVPEGTWKKLWEHLRAIGFRSDDCPRHTP